MTVRSRVGAIGDVHAEDGLLEAALQQLREEGVELVLCTGDVVDGLGEVAACCALLREHGVVTVRGNHDRWFLAGSMRELPHATAVDSVPAHVHELLGSLPDTRRIETPAGGLLLCHGLGENDMARLTPDDFGYAIEVNGDLQALIRDPSVRFVLGGHTHRPMVRHFPGLTVINAGTLIRDQQPCLLVIDFVAGVTVQHWLATDGTVETKTSCPLEPGD